VLSGAAGAEVVNHRCHVRELAGGIGPNIRAVGVLTASAPFMTLRTVAHAAVQL
jgi:hypothetical protein